MKKNKVIDFEIVGRTLFITFEDLSEYQGQADLETYELLEEGKEPLFEIETDYGFEIIWG